MNDIVWLTMRRMRRPLILLILIYTFSVFGMTLIPGQDPAGNPVRTDYLDAMYFVAILATTIGFGEIPHEFNDAQRLWVLFSIYATVVVWIYSIGTLIALLQDPTFRQALTESREPLVQFLLILALELDEQLLEQLTPRQIAAMEPEPESPSVQQPPQN